MPLVEFHFLVNYLSIQMKINSKCKLLIAILKEDIFIRGFLTFKIKILASLVKI